VVSKVFVRKGNYYVFFDLDGRYWVVKVLDRRNYITHESMVCEVVYCFPSAMCSDVMNGVVRVDAVDIDYYTFMFFDVGGISVRVVSGGLVSESGRFVFIHGLRYFDLVKKIEGEGEESFFRKMYFSVLNNLESIESKCRETIESIAISYSNALNHVKDAARSVVEYTNKSLGFVAKPEAIIAAEAALSMVSPPPQPPPMPIPTPTPVKKGFWDRLKEKILSLFRRKKGGLSE
jgi:hypothetical protein